MKKSFTLFAVVTFFALTLNGFAQWDAQKVEKAYQSYLQSLNHPNNGVVESAIINIMKLKLVYPDLDYAKLTKKLETLAFEGDNKSIRYKAYIAANFLKHPARFDWIKPGTYEELNQFFTEYETKLEKQLSRMDNTLVAATDK